MYKFKKALGILGIASAGIFLIAVIVSIMIFQDGVYSPANCFVSELGIYTGTYMAMPSALIFNIGMLLSGLILCAFMVVFGIGKNTILHSATSFFGILCGVLIAANGIFTLGYAQFHYSLLTAYFISAFIMCALYIVAEIATSTWHESNLATMIVALLASVTSAVFAGFMLSDGMTEVFVQDLKQVARIPVMPFAIIEWVSVLLTFAFVTMLAIHMLIENKSVLPSQKNQNKLKVKSAKPTDNIRNIEL